MSAILTRFGLYTLLLALAVFVLREEMSGFPYGEILTNQLLGQIALAGLALAVLGLVTGIFESRRARSIKKKKCVICRGPVLVGEMYCRTHLRQVIADEEDRRHAPIRR